MADPAWNIEHSVSAYDRLRSQACQLCLLYRLIQLFNRTGERGYGGSDSRCFLFVGHSYHCQLSLRLWLRVSVTELANALGLEHRRQGILVLLPPSGLLRASRHWGLGLGVGLLLALTKVFASFRIDHLVLFGHIFAGIAVALFILLRLIYLNLVGRPGLNLLASFDLIEAAKGPLRVHSQGWLNLILLLMRSIFRLNFAGVTTFYDILLC